MNKEVLLEAKNKDSTITVFGIDVDGKAQNLHVLVNGVDITKNLTVDTIQVVLDKEGEA
jgi:hypothetical protein